MPNTQREGWPISNDRKLRGLPAFALFLCFSLAATAQETGADFDGIAANAEAARKQGNIEAATQLYAQAVALKPQWQDGWWFLGVLQYQQNEFVPAHDALSHYLELKPEAGAALALRGLCEFETEQYPESLRDLQHGIALGAASHPRNADIVLYHEALVLTRLGHFEEAIGKYSTFVKQGKVNADLMTGIGLAGLRMPVLPGDVNAPRAPLVGMTGEAAAKVMRGNEDGGREGFEEIFKQFPNAPNVHYFYGYLLFPTDPAAAIGQFKQELAVAPKSAIANGMLGWAYVSQGAYADAMPVAEKAIAEDPSLTLGQLVLGKAMVETDNPSGGIPHLEKVLQSEPENLEAHLTLVKAYSKLGRKDDARHERLTCLDLSRGGTQPRVTP